MLDQHRRIHGPAGTTTRQLLDTSGWPDDLPASASHPLTDEELEAASNDDSTSALAESDGFVACDGYQHDLWLPASTAVPDRLSLARGRWRHLALPSPVADIYGHAHADLTDVGVRRAVLPIWLETGPAETIAEHLTFPQLHAEWPHLELTDELRGCWEACLPELAAEVRHVHPATGPTAA